MNMKNSKEMWNDYLNNFITKSEALLEPIHEFDTSIERMEEELNKVKHQKKLYIGYLLCEGKTTPKFIAQFSGYTESYLYTLKQIYKDDLKSKKINKEENNITTTKE